MTDSLFKYISGKELMERWDIDLVRLWQIRDNALQAYWISREDPCAPPAWAVETDELDLTVIGGIKINKFVTLCPANPPDDQRFMECVFLFEDIEKFEKDHPETIDQPLTKKEAQELGLLRREKAKSDLAMKAVGAVVQWQLGQKYKLTLRTLKTFMGNHFDVIAGKTWNKRIWDVLPKEIKNSGKGNPKEPMS